MQTEALRERLEAPARMERLFRCGAPEARAPEVASLTLLEQGTRFWPAQAGFAFHSRGLQPHGKGAYQIYFSISISPTAGGAYWIYFSIFISPTAGGAYR